MRKCLGIIHFFSTLLVARTLQVDTQVAPSIADDSVDDGDKPDDHFMTSKVKCVPPQAPVFDDAQNLSHIHVTYVAGRALFVPLLSSMLSLAKALKAPELCSIHVLTHDGDMALAEGLVECFKEDVAQLSIASPAVVLHKLDPTLTPGVHQVPKKNLFGLTRKDLETPENYVRYYLHKYLPGVSRVLYIDVDTMVKGDISPMFQMRMDTPMAAALNWKYPTFEHYHKIVAKELRAELPEKTTPVFNNGVLLIDLTRWTDEIVEALDNATVKYAQFQCCTQLPMNMAFRGAFDQLSWSWNVQQLGTQIFPLPSECRKHGQILHFNGLLKPWEHPKGMKKAVPRPNQKLWEEGPACSRTVS